MTDEILARYAEFKEAEWVPSGFMHVYKDGSCDFFSRGLDEMPEDLALPVLRGSALLWIGAEYGSVMYTLLPGGWRLTITQDYSGHIFFTGQGFETLDHAILAALKALEQS